MPHSKSRPLSAVRPEIRDAALTCDIERLERLLGEASRNGRRRQDFLLPLARLYEECGANEEALATWRESFVDEPSLEAGFQILRRESGSKHRLTMDRLREAFSSEAVSVIEDLLHDDPRHSNRNARHVAICGTSYCGSTILGRFLDSFDSFHDIGESHWLIDERTRDGGSAAIDFLAPPSTTMRYCRQCGKDCATLSSRFRLGLQLDRWRWYFRIAGRVNTGILVSSDKNLYKYTSLDPKLRFDAIVLFKSPLSAWSSFRKRLISNDQDMIKTKLEAFISSWIREYKSAFCLEPAGKKLFLHFDRIIAEPKATVAILLQALDLPNHDLKIDAIMKGKHGIGGNDDFFRSTEASDRIEIRSSHMVRLSKDEMNLIAASNSMTELFDQMLTRSRALFGPS